MFGISTRRLVVGAVLAGAVVVAVGAPAIATQSQHRQAPAHHSVTMAPVTVNIGTAVQYVRDPDGTVRQVTPR